MNVLVYPSFFPTPHFETELELILNNLSQGHKVIIVCCTGQLESCHINPKHKKSFCIRCISTFNQGISLIRSEKLSVVHLPSVEESGVNERQFKNIDELMNYSFEGYDIGRFIASTLISRFNKDHRLNTIKYSKEINTELRVALFVRRAFEKLFNDIVPDRVILFNGRFTQIAPVVQLCMKQGIEFVTHDRAGLLDRYELVWNRYIHDLSTHITDIEECWLKGKESEREAIGIKWFQDRQRHIIQSWIPFAKIQKKGQLPEQFDPSKRNIAIFNSTIEEYVWLEECRNPVYEDELEAISKIAYSCKDNGEFDIYLRIHPNMENLHPHQNSQLRYLYALKGKYPNFHIIPPKSAIDSYALLKNSEKIITFGSTMGVEACFMGKPSILIGSPAYKNLGCCYRPTTHNEVMELIQKKLEPKESLGAIKYGYWEMRKGILYNYYKPTGIFTGKFMGKTVLPDLFVHCYSLIIQIFEVRSARDFIEYLHQTKAFLNRITGKI